MNRKRVVRIKRLVDIAGALGLLVILGLPMFIAAIAVRVSLGPPTLYRQRRTGLKDVPFDLLKFRTMTQERDQDGHLLPDGLRVTRVGRFLRRWSLDELPQLLNVIVGDMSLVGPRPLLLRYLPRYNQRQRLRSSVKPGITGWAQINGRTGIDWTKRLEMDVWYVEHQSFLVDIKILFRTLIKVLTGEGAYKGDSSEIGEFWGEGGAPGTGPKAHPVEMEEL